MKHTRQKKYITALLVSVAVLFILGSCTGYQNWTESINPTSFSSENFTYEVTGGNATITGSSGSGAEVSIPETLDGYTVSTIGEGAFSGDTTVTAVTVPSTITAIGSSAFSGCTALTSITVKATTPPSLESDVFADCSSLTYIYVPDGCYGAYIAADGWSEFAAYIVVSAGTVTFDKNAEDATGTMDGQTITGGTSANLTVCAFSRNGYSFGGWATSATSTDVAYADSASYTMIKGSATLYAKWTIVTYDITYDLDDGTNRDENPETYTIESPTITLASPAKDGYTFAGWYSDSTFTTGVTEITSGSTGNRELYAKWTINQGISITISTLSVDDGSIEFSQTVEVTKGENLTVSINKDYSEYYWLLDGDIYTEEGARKSITLYTNDPERPIAVGIHELTVCVVDSAGTTYSAGIRITVTD